MTHKYIYPLYYYLKLLQCIESHLFYNETNIPPHLLLKYQLFYIWASLYILIEYNSVVYSDTLLMNAFTFTDL